MYLCCLQNKYNLCILNLVMVVKMVCKHQMDKLLQKSLLQDCNEMLGYIIHAYGTNCLAHVSYYHECNLFHSFDFITVPQLFRQCCRESTLSKNKEGSFRNHYSNHQRRKQLF